MKKVLMLLLAAGLACLVPVLAEEIPAVMQADGTVSLSTALPEALYPVLTGNAAFETQDGMRTMDALADCFGIEAPVAPTDFAVLDMDGDTSMEAVVRAAIGSVDLGFLVLDAQADGVYGHAFTLRAMLALKQDGTFSFSSGAMDNGVGIASFAGAAAEVTELARCVDGADGAPVYALCGVTVAEDAYETFLRAQDEKPDVDWCPFTQAQLEAWFAAR